MCPLNQLIADLHAHFFCLVLKCYDDRALLYIVIELLV